MKWRVNKYQSTEPDKFKTFVLAFSTSELVFLTKVATEVYFLR